MTRFLNTAILSAALLVSVGLPVARGDDHDRDDRDRNRAKIRRYYDRNSRDWHEWNDREAQAYRRYLQENRLRQLEWERANAAQQRAYWRWRHQHPDVYGDRR